jgi:hypothetical protein
MILLFLYNCVQTLLSCSGRMSFPWRIDHRWISILIYLLLWVRSGGRVHIVIDIMQSFSAYSAKYRLDLKIITKVM